MAWCGAWRLSAALPSIPRRTGLLWTSKLILCPVFQTPPQNATAVGLAAASLTPVEDGGIFLI